MNSNNDWRLNNRLLFILENKIMIMRNDFSSSKNLWIKSRKESNLKYVYV